MSSSVKVNWNQAALERIQAKFIKGVFSLAYDLASQSRGMAPVDTGNLKSSIRVQESNGAVNIIAGGNANSVNVPYARRQEFEHKTKNGYMRKPFERMFQTDAWKTKYFGGITK